MRVLVTGAGNPTGEAIVQALLREGHQVRVFGVDEAVMQKFEGDGEVDWFPGDLRVGGSIEPPLSEREALVHAACMDPYSGRADKQQMAVQIDRGTLYTRYGAERELVDHFIHVAPTESKRDPYRVVQRQALEHVKKTRGPVNVEVVRASDDPGATAAQVISLLQEMPPRGVQPGRQSDAKTP